MRIKVVVYPSDEGYAVSAPSLPGCWSQGVSREEALANIADAIRSTWMPRWSNPWALRFAKSRLPFNCAEAAGNQSSRGGASI
jgi:hypothetical protein